MKNEFLNAILSEKDDIKARGNMRFYKTGIGEYAEGDIFLGLTYPQNRRIAKMYYKTLLIADLEDLLSSKYHEVRACTILAAVLKYSQGGTDEKS